jgi:hypothetical protein
LNPRRTRLVFAIAAASFALNLAPSHRALSETADPWKALSFLEGTWEARTQSGPGGARVIGTYTFELEFKRHVLARHTASVACKGPQDFDCEHGDLLYVYQEADSQSLKAIYFDNEGHVIHYTVSTPQSAKAIFVSDISSSGPQFQLVYELKNAVMSGKFQMRMPGQAQWRSYLEWSGQKKPATVPPVPNESE